MNEVSFLPTLGPMKCLGAIGMFPERVSYRLCKMFDCIVLLKQTVTKGNLGKLKVVKIVCNKMCIFKIFQGTFKLHLSGFVSLVGVK